MNIALLDYGTGNLHSLAKAMEAHGARVSILPDLSSATAADAIVLPGVGAFGAAAQQLAASAETLRVALATGTPCLGICLGMQLLFNESEEGTGAGLGVMEGTVRRLVARRTPHMGWNDVGMADDPLFEGVPQLQAYFANSYIVEPADGSDVIAWTQYDGVRFPAAVRRDNVWGMQFHPEKSGRDGLRLIGNFLGQVRR
ncbi:MAG TPA: imidazole glycerol phosphate synthase subunit HisH [Longimicrobiales bacterium]|nr:imidazole glycerol phosphate synthase subunit HisH [Longimicrobiales bacterium]